MFKPDQPKACDQLRQLEHKESGMRTPRYRIALLLAAVFASGIALLTAGAASAQQQAITATVTGASGP
jgi:hypothetical protein